MKTGAVVREERTRKFKFIAFSAIAIAALAMFSQLDFVYQSPESETAPNGDITITLKQNASGHYLAKGTINNEPVSFIVDTGATTVAVPIAIAKKIGLPLGQKLFTKTANGIGTSYESSAKSVQLGDITLSNIRVTASTGLMGEEALLGMSFLKEMKIEQSDGVMKITY